MCVDVGRRKNRTSTPKTNHLKRKHSEEEKKTMYACCVEYVESVLVLNTLKRKQTHTQPTQAQHKYLSSAIFMNACLCSAYELC